MRSFKQFCEASDDIAALAAKYKVDAKALKTGMKVEQEHKGYRGKDTKVEGDEVTAKIAVAHLREDPRYYDKLKTIEDH